MMRLVRVGFSLAVAGPGKLVLLGTLLATGIVVFLTISGLSLASGDALADQIDNELGETGTYALTLLDALQLPPEDLHARLYAVADQVGARRAQVVDGYPPVAPECPPLEAIGDQVALVARTRQGGPADLPFGENLPDGTRLCLDGQVIPSSALALPDEATTRTFGSGILVHPDYETVLRLATTGQITRRLVLTTGQVGDQRAAVMAALDTELGEAAGRADIVLADVVLMQRLDEGDGIRTASEGIVVVYRLIGVGVLGLGALALLVAETIVVRQRLWLFGLVRALGGRAWHIIALIAVDVAAVVAVGVGAALLMCVIVQPLLTPFALDAFDVDVRLLQAGSLPALLAGVIGILVAATSYPAWLAVREDPASVLERP